MTIARFEVFSHVVEQGSFTKAAGKLNMTQSAVSHAVASLESEWGVALLIRDRRRGLLLTEVGQKMLIPMREILNQMEIIKQEAALASNLEAGTIRIGSFPSASANILPSIISKYNQKHPNTAFTFYEGTYEEILEWFETGVIDIGFVIQQNKELNLHIVPLVKDKMVVAFPADHRFQREDVIDVHDLQEEDFIMPKGLYRANVEEIFEQAQVTPRIRFEVQDCNTISSMVQEGLGVTIGPELSFKNQPNIGIGNLKQSSWRKVALASPPLQCTSPAVQAFFTVAKTMFARTGEQAQGSGSIDDECAYTEMSGFLAKG